MSTAELKGCPFCGCEVRIVSNRDWHRLGGDHTPECIFDEQEHVMVPATETERAWLISAWNGRVAQGGLLTDDAINLFESILHRDPEAYRQPGTVIYTVTASEVLKFATALRATAHIEQGEAVAWAHPDEVAVDLFAVAMKAKLAMQRAKGYCGWDDPAQCTVESLAEQLMRHTKKGDPVDVANFAMMLHQRDSEREVLTLAALDFAKRVASLWLPAPPPAASVGSVGDDELIRLIDAAQDEWSRGKVDGGLRLHIIKSVLKAIDARQPPAAVVNIDRIRALHAKLEQWRTCMSYNDSYFGEPAGLVKSVVREMDHWLNPGSYGKPVAAAPAQSKEPK